MACPARRFQSKMVSETESFAAPPARRQWHKAGMIVNTARAAADLLGPLFTDARREKLAVAYLDRARCLLALDEDAAHGPDWMTLPVRGILGAALARDAAGLVIAHNHPSGDPTPSAADIAATRRLAEAAERLDVRLHDHLVFAADDCRSFRALGLL